MKRANNLSLKYALVAILFIAVLAGAIVLSNQDRFLTGYVVQSDSYFDELTDDDAVLGSVNAKVTIVQFTDWQCPFCRRFETDTFNLIKKEYIDSGKVKFITRDFPLEFHASAFPAALAAECVKEKGGSGAYYLFKELVNSEQNKLDSGSATGKVTKTVTFTENDLINWANSIGYDISYCLKNERFSKEVQKDLSDGEALGIKGTPAFLIMKSNGGYDLISGAQPYEVFQSAINKALNE